MSLWCPTDTDWSTLREWLLTCKPTTPHFQLAMLITDKLNWGLNVQVTLATVCLVVFRIHYSSNTETQDSLCSFPLPVKCSVPATEEPPPDGSVTGRDLYHQPNWQGSVWTFHRRR